MRKQISTYRVEHAMLDNGSYEYEFQVDGALFEGFENEEISDAKLDVNITLVKKTEGLQLILQGNGKIDLQCDRCLDYFLQPINAEHEVDVHLSDETDFDTDEDYVCLDRSAEHIDLSYFIYEMVMLSLPIRRVHPEDEDGNSMCNPDVVKYITGESSITDLEGDIIEEAEADEKWKEDLKNLFNN